eukprot:3799655-Pleurochrysis_carterae.AAC.1
MLGLGCIRRRPLPPGRHLAANWLKFNMLATEHRHTFDSTLAHFDSLLTDFGLNLTWLQLDVGTATPI